MNRRGAAHAVGIESWELTSSMKGESDMRCWYLPIIL